MDPPEHFSDDYVTQNTVSQDKDKIVTDSKTFKNGQESDITHETSG